MKLRPSAGLFLEFSSNYSFATSRRTYYITAEPIRSILHKRSSDGHPKTKRFFEEKDLVRRTEMRKAKLVPLLLTLCFAVSTAAPLFAKYDPDRAYQYFRETFDLHNRSLTGYLLSEMDQYLNVFPEGKHAAEVQYLMGKVFEEDRSKNNALACHLKLIFLYPESSHRSESADVVRNLLANEKRYAENKDAVIQAMGQVEAHRSFEDRYFAYLGLLATINESSLFDWSLSSCRDFIRLFPKDKRSDRVLQWMCDIYAAKGKEDPAASCYAQFATLYPESDYLPQVLNSQGMLLYKEIEDYEKAIEVLKSVYTLFPEGDDAAHAMYLVGEIKEEELDDYKGAIEHYRKCVDVYTTSPKAPDALWNIAKIQRYELEDPEAAVLILREFIQKYAGDPRAKKALVDIADIYKRAGNHAKAAEALEEIAQTYPVDEKAAGRFYDACYMWEMRVKDPVKATSCYQMLIEKYPSDKKATKASKRLEKLGGGN